MKKKSKNKSRRRANRARPQEQDSRVREPDGQPEPGAVQNQRLFYAGGAALIVILGAIVIWVIIHKPSKGLVLPPLPPAATSQEQTTEPAVAPSTRVFRDRLKNGAEGLEMVMIEAGSFQMGDVLGDGDKAAQPVHTVKLQKPFAIGRYEVTFDEYDQFAQATGRKLPNDGGGGRGRRPVINLSWQEAVDYAQWLSTETGKRYRLPTEAEWEYAARGGKETAFWWGNQMKSGIANCLGCGSEWDNKLTAPVGSFQPNPFGLYDTAGNVWEWVEDCDHENYNDAPTNGVAWKKEGDGNCYLRVMRGGAWNYGPKGLRSSFRGRADPGLRSYAIGLRLIREME